MTAPAGITDQQITDQVASAGYKARIKRPTHVDPEESARHEAVATQHAEHAPAHEDHMAHGGAASELQPAAHRRGRSGGAGVRSSRCSPAFQFPNWGWVVGALALPVVSWAAWPFHRAAAINARHFASTMDTLVSLGVIAAYLFSAWQLLAIPRLTEHPGMDEMGGAGSGGLYFEVASRCHHVPAAGPLSGGERQDEGGRRAQGPAGPGRQGRHHPARRHRSEDPGGPAGPRAT